MFKPTVFFIGLRYIRAKRRNHFISFISLASMLGIALGITALITVLSVMNGFDREIKKRILSIVPPITIGSMTGYLAGWQDLQKIVDKYPVITASAPFVTGNVLLSYGETVRPAIINGILPEQESKVTEIAEKMINGKLTDLHQGKFGII